MNTHAIGVPNKQRSATCKPEESAHREAKAAASVQVSQGLPSHADLGAGVGLRGGIDAAGAGSRKDQRLEDFKKAVMNEIELDFSWYCREKRRTRQEMEEWWDKRDQLVDALLESAWPAWGTAGALRRCQRLVELRAGGRKPNSSSVQTGTNSNCSGRAR